jgi:signal transduction histidine kinase
MRFPKIVAAQRLQTSLLVAALLSVFLIGVLVVDLTRNLRTVVISETQRTLGNAASELSNAVGRGDHESASYETLRSYPEVEGGYLDGDLIVGHTFPTHTERGSQLRQPELEYREVLGARDDSRTTGRIAHRVVQDGRDLVLVAVAKVPNSDTWAWSLRRIFHFSDTSELNKRLLLVAVMLIALISIGFVLKLSFSMQRGFAVIQTGLERLRTDASYRLPDQDHELSSIVRAVNTMAEGRQSLEADLRREDRLRVMGRVVAGIAHEIRNPLNSIRLTIRVLARKLQNEPATQKPINLITDEIDRLDRLLKSLLVFRSDSVEKIRQQPIQPILHRTLALVKPHAQEHGVSIQSSSTEDCLAFVDGDYLQQALMNLLLNAIDASGRDGTVDIDVQRRDGHIHVDIEDNGPGLTDEQKERMFEAFYTTKASGTGLGLAVTKTLLEKMGATVEAAHGIHGARFRVVLPTEQKA